GRPLIANTRETGLVVGFVHDQIVRTDTGSLKSALSYFDVSLATDTGPIRVTNCGTILKETAEDILKKAGKNFSIAPPNTGDLVAVDIGAYSPDLLPDDPL